MTVKTSTQYELNFDVDEINVTNAFNSLVCIHHTNV